MLGLTWPQFVEVTAQLEKLRYRRALCEVFFGTAAVLDQRAKNNLFSCSPTLLRDAAAAPVLSFTPEELARAEARAEEYLKQEKDNNV